MSELVEKKEDLIRYFEEGAKPREQWRVGTEYEKVAVRTRDARAMPYSGPGGVEELLRRMTDRYGFEPRKSTDASWLSRGRAMRLRSSPAGKSSSPANSAIPSIAPTPSSLPTYNN